MAAKREAKPKLPRISVIRTESVPIGGLKPYVGNARRGDVDAIEESVGFHGQYKPIVANLRTKQILVGNHTFKAMKRAGAKDILVSWVNVSKAEEREINLVDNATADKGKYEDKALVRMLEAARKAGDIRRSGYTDKTVENLLSRVRSATSATPGAAAAPGQSVPPAPRADRYQVLVNCADEAQQTALVARLHGEGFDVRTLVGWSRRWAPRDEPKA
jgi:ParB-like chromosome segregation protein Spo0J